MPSIFTKTMFAAAMAVLASTYAHAADPGCNPSQGNWVNAATQTCAVSDASHTAHNPRWDAPPPKPVKECEHPKKA